MGDSFTLIPSSPVIECVGACDDKSTVGLFYVNSCFGILKEPLLLIS